MRFSLWIFTTFAIAGVVSCVFPNSMFGEITATAMTGLYACMAIGGWRRVALERQNARKEAALAAITREKDDAKRKQSAPVGYPAGAGSRKARG